MIVVDRIPITTWLEPKPANYYYLISRTVAVNANVTISSLNLPLNEYQTKKEIIVCIGLRVGQFECIEHNRINRRKNVKESDIVMQMLFHQ